MAPTRCFPALAAVLALGCSSLPTPTSPIDAAGGGDDATLDAEDSGPTTDDPHAYCRLVCGRYAVCTPDAGTSEASCEENCVAALGNLRARPGLWSALGDCAQVTTCGALGDVSASFFADDCEANYESATTATDAVQAFCHALATTPAAPDGGSCPGLFTAATCPNKAKLFSDTALEGAAMCVSTATTCASALMCVQINFGMPVH